MHRIVTGVLALVAAAVLAGVAWGGGLPSKDPLTATFGQPYKVVTHVLNGYVYQCGFWRFYDAKTNVTVREYEECQLVGRETLPKGAHAKPNPSPKKPSPPAA